MADLSVNFNWTNAIPILGSRLAHSRLTKSLRALQAAEAVAGTKVLFKPTGPQAAALWGVSPAYVYLAAQVLRDDNLVGLVRDGYLSLTDAVATLQRRSSSVTIEPAAVGENWVRYARPGDVTAAR